MEQTVQALKSCKLGLGLIFLIDDPASKSNQILDQNNKELMIYVRKKIIAAYVLAVELFTRDSKDSSCRLATDLRSGPILAVLINYLLSDRAKLPPCRQEFNLKSKTKIEPDLRLAYNSLPPRSLCPSINFITYVKVTGRKQLSIANLVFSYTDAFLYQSSAVE